MNELCELTRHQKTVSNNRYDLLVMRCNLVRIACYKINKQYVFIEISHIMREGVNISYQFHKFVFAKLQCNTSKKFDVVFSCE